METPKRKWEAHRGRSVHSPHQVVPVGQLDLASFITLWSPVLIRNDLCVPNHETSCQETWGLAYVGGACQDYNCALVKDRGLLSAYSIAHEIGHR